MRIGEDGPLGELVPICLDCLAVWREEPEARGLLAAEPTEAAGPDLTTKARN